MIETPNDVIRRIINPFIFGNLVISLCATMLLLETYIQLGLPVQVDGLAFLVFFATLSLYNLHRLLATRYISPEDRGVITGWAAKHRFTHFMLALIGAGGVGFFVFQLSLPLFGMLVILGLVSLIYELPWISYNQRFAKLRNVWLSRAFLLATVWTLTTVLLPAIHLGMDFMRADIWLLLAERMFFIFLIALCFDERDAGFDERAGFKTIPVQYGIQATQLFYKIVTGGLIIVSCIHYFIVIPFYWMGVAMILSAIATWWVVSKASSRQAEYYYLFVVDGMMIVQFMLVWLFSQVHAHF